MANENVKHLMDLYNLCIEANDYTDDFDIIEPLHPEEEFWLSGAIDVYTESMNHVKRIELNLSYLRQEALERQSDADIAQYIASLKELQDITEHIEFAKDFVKMGGLTLIEELLEDDNNSLCYETSVLLGTVNQNNCFCQIETVRQNLIEKLMAKIPNKSDNQLVKKLIFALSCSVRGNDAAFDRFSRANGFNMMLTLIRTSPSSAIRCKIAFFINCILSEFDQELLGQACTLQRCLEELHHCILELTSFEEPETEHLLAGLSTLLLRLCPGHVLSRQQELIAVLLLQQTRMVEDRPEALEIAHYIAEILCALVPTRMSLCSTD